MKNAGCVSVFGFQVSRQIEIKTIFLLHQNNIFLGNIIWTFSEFFCCFRWGYNITACSVQFVLPLLIVFTVYVSIYLRLKVIFSVLIIMFFYQFKKGNWFLYMSQNWWNDIFFFWLIKITEYKKHDAFHKSVSFNVEK